MEAEASAIAFKISSDHRTLRFTSYLLVAAFALNLVVRLLVTVPQLLTGSPIAFADIAFIIAFSIFLFGALYSLTPRYQRANLQGLNKWYRKSEAERFRTLCVTVSGALTLALLPIFALIFVEMERSPGQDIGTYFLAVIPVYMLIVAVFTLGTVVWRSRRAP